MGGVAHEFVELLLHAGIAFHLGKLGILQAEYCSAQNVRSQLAVRIYPDFPGSEIDARFADVVDEFGLFRR